jgi:hypothetical protein
MIARKLWTILAVGLLLIGISGICYGDETQGPQGTYGPQGLQQPPMFDQTKINEEFGKALDELITVKVITVEQKTKIIEYFEKSFAEAKGPEGKDLENKGPEKGPEDPKGMNCSQKRGADPLPLSLLVKDGIINQDQAAVIARVWPGPFRMGWKREPHDFLAPLNPERVKAYFKKKMKPLVSLKVITEKQSVTIEKYYTEAFDKMKDKKPGVGPQKGNGFQGERRNVLERLVKDGVINQKQADVIAEIFPAHMPMREDINRDLRCINV